MDFAKVCKRYIIQVLSTAQYPHYSESRESELHYIVIPEMKKKWGYKRKSWKQRIESLANALEEYGYDRTAWDWDSNGFKLYRIEGMKTIYICNID